MKGAVDRTDWAVIAARSVVEPAAEKAVALAATTGVAVTVKTSVYVDDGSKHWATVLAELLCANPDLAKGNRDKLSNLLAANMQLDSFTANRLSKPLSKEQVKHVSAILTAHGYDSSTLSNGLSIRDIIKGNVKRGSVKPTTVTTKFYADHIELDGASFQYRPRERTATGKVENDFCIRVAGVDVPLMAVLRLRSIGLGEFRLADRRAVDNADATQRQNRGRIGREYVEPSQLNRLYNEMQRATRESDKEQRKARNRHVDIWSYTGTRVDQSLSSCVNNKDDKDDT